MSKVNINRFLCFKSLVFLAVLFSFIFLFQTQTSYAGFVAPCSSTADHVISSDGTGCNGSIPGTFNSTTKTCTLTADVSGSGPDGTGTIEIDGNGITLDYDGYEIDANNGQGVCILNQSNVTVKDCNIVDATDGIFLDQTSASHFINNYVAGSGGESSRDGVDLERSTSNYFISNRFETTSDGFEVQSSHHNYFINNTIDGTQSDGFDLENSSNNKLIANSTDGNGSGNDGYEIDDKSNSNELIGNKATDHGNSGFEIEDGASNNTFIANTSTDNDFEGFEMSSSAGKNNFFKDNTTSGNGQEGFEDTSMGKKTGGTANTYINNKCPDGQTNTGPGKICI